MKCIDCILFGTSRRNPENITTAMVQDVVDDAREAVTLVDGDALCVEHLHRRVVSSIGRTITNSKANR
jgi:hypothetical protein